LKIRDGFKIFLSKKKDKTMEKREGVEPIVREIKRKTRKHIVVKKR